MPAQDLEAWLTTHQAHYIAHAVWGNNVPKVLTSGHVEPAEWQLRTAQQVSCEAGMYGDRAHVSNADFLQQLRGKPIPLPVITVVYDATIDLLTAYNFGFITDDLIDSLPALESGASHVIALAEGKSLRITDTKKARNKLFSYEVKLENIPWAISNGDSSRLADYHSREQIAIDSIAAESIDKRLSMVWEANKGLCNQRALFRHLLMLRRTEISSSSICPEIRTTLNVIAWGYGSVAILRGKPKTLLSVGNTTYNDRDFRKKEEEVQFCTGRELFLLMPFENHGKGLTLNLAQEDTLVIGPQAVLSSFQESMQRRGIRFCYFEEMNQQQLDFFKVPAALRLVRANQRKPITQAQADAIKKLSIFADKMQQKESLSKWQEKIDSKP